MRKKKKRGGWNSPNFKRKGQGGEPRDLSACDLFSSSKSREEQEVFLKN